MRTRCRRAPKVKMAQNAQKDSDVDVLAAAVVVSAAVVVVIQVTAVVVSTLVVAAVVLLHRATFHASHFNHWPWIATTVKVDNAAMLLDPRYY